MEFLKEYWWMILIGVVCLFFLIGLIRAMVKKRRANSYLIVDAISEGADVAVDVAVVSGEAIAGAGEVAAEVVGEIASGL